MNWLAVHMVMRNKNKHSCNPKTTSRNPKTSFNDPPVSPPGCSKLNPKLFAYSKTRTLAFNMLSKDARYPQNFKKAARVTVKMLSKASRSAQDPQHTSQTNKSTLLSTPCFQINCLNTPNMLTKHFFFNPQEAPDLLQTNKHIFHNWSYVHCARCSLEVRVKNNVPLMRTFITFRFAPEVASVHTNCLSGNNYDKHTKVLSKRP